MSPAVSSTTSPPVTSPPTTAPSDGDNDGGDDDDAPIESTLPEGAVEGLDDFDQDEDPDPICGVTDFGGGLLLQVPCEVFTANEPEDGTTLVEDSLYALPGDNFVELENVSATAIQARDDMDRLTTVFLLNSDTLFAIGSSDLSEPAQDALNGIIAALEGHFDGQPVELRGHTDAIGDRAANDKLSADRAASVADYFGSHGLDRSNISIIGLGSAVPIVQESSGDEAADELGRAQNRRVEVVVRVAS